MPTKNRSEKVIGRCDQCRAQLRVGRNTQPEHYPTAAASKRWTYTVKPNEGWAHVICAKCLDKQAETEQQGTLL